MRPVSPLGLVVLVIANSFMLSLEVRAENRLTTLSALAERATLQINVEGIDCRYGTAVSSSGSAIMVSNTVAVTSAHMFANEQCENSDVVATGIFRKETEEGVSGETATYELELYDLDVASDIAVLEIAGEPGVLPDYRPLCLAYQPKAGDILYAFGYPLGSPLTPLPLTFSRKRSNDGMWIVSGLTIDGMSGGGVLDQYGNLVGLIQGGAFASNGESDIEVYALRYVTPITGLIGIVNAEWLQDVDNCGPQTVPVLRPESEWYGPDSERCNLSLPAGFTLTTSSIDGKVSEIALKPRLESAGGAEAYKGLVDSSFEVRITRTAIPQPGPESRQFDQEKDVLSCAAAVKWFSKAREQGGWEQYGLLASFMSAISRGKGHTAQGNTKDCYEDSVWPSHFLDGHPAERPILIPYKAYRLPFNPPSDEEEFDFDQAVMRFTRTEETFLGSVEIVEREFDVRGVDDDIEAIRELVETGDTSLLYGLVFRCRSTPLIAFTDFQSMCKVLVEKLTMGRGNRSANCMTQVKVSTE